MFFVFVQDVVCVAARELVDSIGAHDPLTSSQYLALYQVSKLSRVRFWDRGGWILHPQTSTAVKNSFTWYHEFFRDLSCYVDKIIKKWIAVFSSGFTRSLLYVNTQLSGRYICQANWQMPFKLRYWKGASTPRILSPFLWISLQLLRLLRYLRTYVSFLFLDLKMTCACRLCTN